MPNRSHHRHFLTLLLLVWLFVSGRLECVNADDIYLRSEQTDADYKPERIEELTGLLKSKEVKDRTGAIWALRELGPESMPAIPTLIELLEDDTGVAFYPTQMKYIASSSLGTLKAEATTSLIKKYSVASPQLKKMIALAAKDIGDDARELLPLFRKEFNPEDEDSRKTYLIAIASIDPTGEIALPLLLQTLQTAPDEWDRRFAAECLRRLQERPALGMDVYSRADQWFKSNPQRAYQVVRILLQALKDESSEVRSEVIRTLATYPELEQKIVPQLLPLLTDDSSSSVVMHDVVGFYEIVSGVAVRALKQFPNSAERSVPALVNWTLTGDRSRVYQAEEVLAELIPLTEHPVEHAEKILKGQNSDLSFLTLARLGERAAPFIETLEMFTDSKENEIALKAKLTLGCLDERWQLLAIKVFEEECESFSKDDYKYSSDVFTFLAEVGEHASFVRRAVQGRLQSMYTGDKRLFYTRLPSAQLVQIMARTGVADTELISLILSDGYISDAEKVEASLVEMCPEAVPGLITHLSDVDCPPQHRILCLRVLGAAHASNPELFPLVIAQLKSNHPAVRESAAEALGNIGTKNEQSLKALIESLDDPRVRVRVKALESLAKFGPEAKPAVPKIVDFLSDDYLTVRIAAVRCLGELGAAAATALDELEKLKDSESLLLRETSEEAIGLIRSKM